MRLKFIALCVPSLGQVSIHWASALMDLMWPLNTGKASLFVVGKPVAEARNECVKRALDFSNDKREISHLFWVDDDVLVPRTALIHLLRHQRDIASGVYFTKGDVGEPLIFPGRGCGTLPFVPDQVLDVWGHGSGLTLVKADVYRRMQAELKLPNDRYGYPEWYKTTGSEECVLDGDVLWDKGTEDLYFCNRAVGMGYKPLVDCSSNAFGWHLDLATQQGYPKEQFEQLRAGKPILWPTAEGLKEWSS